VDLSAKNGTQRANDVFKNHVQFIVTKRVMQTMYQFLPEDKQNALVLLGLTTKLFN
jgi:hypothetical protein